MVQRTFRRASPYRHRGARRSPPWTKRNRTRRAARARSLEHALSGAVVRLRQVQSTVAVAVAALRRQNCELDEDIATLLQRCVCDRIEDQLHELEAARHLLAARLRRV